MKAKSKKGLSKEDRKLWQSVTATVNPLVRQNSVEEKFRKEFPEFYEPEFFENDTPRKNAKTSSKIAKNASLKSETGKAAIAKQRSVQGLRPIVPLSKREKSRLSRSIYSIDAKLDLHGMTQNQAYIALNRFLRNAQQNEWRVVLIITGKGRKNSFHFSKDQYFEKDNVSGVLREKVPVWLRDPSLRDVVLSVELAGKSHGGSGAIYVKIRKLGQPTS